LSIDTSHADDVVRVGDKAPTLTSRDYKGGNTILAAIPVADKATRNKGGGDTRNDDGAGNGLGVGEPGAPAYTLTAADRHGVAYAIDRAAFNQGANVQYDISIQEEIAQTLVAKGPGAVAHPSCYAMQAIGEYKESDKASTLKQRDYKDNTDLVVTPNSPCYTVDDMKMQNTYIWEEQANTLAQRDYKSPQAVAYPTEMEESLWEYIVRRLTPLECCRLQGFPDYWTQELGIAEPTEDDILYWRMVFREQAEALGETKKEKTDNQIRKWLQNPSSDSAVYKMWGNGIALPNAMFVMEGIAEILQEENNHEE
jgi:DNA (cytosine-5)-methyltransferase 1